MRIVRALKAVILTAKARDLAAHRQFSVALYHLQRAFSSAGFEFISDDAPYDMNLLAAQIEIGVVDGPKALSAAMTATAQIKSDKKIRDQDRLYLIHYCNALIDYCEVWRDGADTPAGKTKDIALSGVSRHLLNNYPLSKSGYFV